MTPKGKILIVDDEEALRFVLAAALAVEGYEVKTAADGDEAASMAAAENFDLVMVDLIMPQKDGFQTINSIRAVFPDIRVIAMSGGGGRNCESFLRTAARVGAGRALSKPFSKAEMLSAIEDELAREPSESIGS